MKRQRRSLAQWQRIMEQFEASGQAASAFCSAHDLNLEYFLKRRAPELNAFRRSAFEWLATNSQVFWVQQGVTAMRGLYHRSGPLVEAFRLRGLDPRHRAKMAWARLRQGRVDERISLAAWLGVELAIANDPQAVIDQQFKRVQAAKLVHRLASGTHRIWDSGPVRQELHAYPQSRGRVLGYIGEELERVAEHLVAHHLDDIETVYSERVAAGMSNSVRPHPRWAKVRNR